MGLLRRLIRLLFRPSNQTRHNYSPPSRVTRVAVETYVETRVIVSVPPPAPPPSTVLQGKCWVVDGDTIVISDTRIRIAGIDAPELDHPWGQKAKWALVQLCKGRVVTARIKPELSYDRLVAECFLGDGRDIAAEMVRGGHALDWPKFSGGKYRHLETADARRRFWRADARQRGKLPPSERRQIPD